MREAGCRGQEYFTPGTCVPESGLEFYCTSSGTGKHGGRYVFSYNMRRFGVEWEEVRKNCILRCGCISICGHRKTLHDVVYEGFCGSLRDERPCERGILKYKCKQWPITITSNFEDVEWGKEYDQATTQILRFQTTVTQSFISGYGAISLYDDYTSNYEIIRWPQNDPDLKTHRDYQERYRTQTYGGSLSQNRDVARNIREESQIVETFTGRGFKFVEHNSRGASAHGGADFMGRYGGRIRSMGDSGVLQIPFQRYLNTSNWEFPFEVYWEAFNYITWYETATKTAWVPGMLDILDFPFQRKTPDTWDTEWKGSNQVFSLVERGVWFELWLEYKFHQLQENQRGCFSETLDDFKKRFMKISWYNPLSRYPC